MRALILAAGLGTRMRPLSDHLPKPLFPFANTPLLDYHLELLRANGIQEAAINLHHLPQPIKKYLGDGSRFGLALKYSFEPELLGTAGGIKQMAKLLPRDTLVVLNSDMLTNIDLKEVLKFHRQHKALVTMVLNPHHPLGNYRGVGVDSKYRIHQIAGLPEAAPADIKQLLFIGIHLIEPEVLDYIPAGKPCCINTDTYPQLIEQGRPIYAYPLESGFWQHVGTLDSYLDSHREFLDGRDKSPVSPQANIILPVMIGANCHLSAQATIGPYAVLGKGCRLDEHAVVEHSVLWDGVKVGAGARLNRCIVGHNTVIDASQSLANQMIAL